MYFLASEYINYQKYSFSLTIYLIRNFIIKEKHKILTAKKKKYLDYFKT